MTAFAPGIDEVRARTFPFPRRHFLSAMDLNVVEAQQLLDLADGFVALNRQTTKKLSTTAPPRSSTCSRVAP